MNVKGFYTKLVGVSFLNNDGSSRQGILNQCSDISEENPLPLYLARDTENPYDPNAIAVYTEEGKQLGYLSRKINEIVAPWLEQGENVFVEGVCITGGFPGHLGLNIWLEKRTAA